MNVVSEMFNGWIQVKTKTKVLIFFAIISIIMVIQYLMPNIGQTHYMRMEPTGRGGVTYTFDASPSFHSNSSGNFYFSNRSGISMRTSNGDIRFSSSFSFNNPIMVARGDIVAIGEERGGRRIYVFNADGFMYRVDLEDPIMNFSVNEAGFLAVVVQFPTGHGIRVFNQRSSTAPLYSRDIVGQAQTLWFPTSVEVSNNGRYIVVAIVDLYTTFRTHLQFGYINQVDGLGTGNVYGLFSAETFHGQLVYDMRFMTDNRLVVVTRDRIICYQINTRSYAVSTQHELWSINLRNDLAQIGFYGNRHFIYVTGDRHLGEVDALPVGSIRIVNTDDGEETGYFNLGRRATHLSVGHGAVLIGADRSFHAIDLRGNHLWEHNVLYDVRGRDVIFLDNVDTILVAGANRAEIFERNRVRVGEMESAFE